MKFLSVLFLLALSASAQIITVSDVQSLGKVDMGSAVSTIPAKKGTLASIPAACTQGEGYFATDATAGSNVYGCDATNHWSLQSGGGGAGGANVTLNNLGTTSVNADLLPSAAGTRAIGSASLPWSNLWVGPTALKRFRFDFSGVVTNASRKIILPDTDAVFVQPQSGPSASQWIQYVDTFGLTHYTQPAFTDIAGAAVAAQLPNSGVHTGDAAGTFPVITLTTVNGAPGGCGDSTHVCVVTTNGKGLVTSQNATAIAAGAGTVTHTIGALTLNQLIFGAGAADAKVGDLSGDVTTMGTPATTLATVNAGPGGCGDSTHVCTVTTNGKGLVTSQSAVAISVSGGTVTHTGALTANLPVFGNGAADTIPGTLQGNTTKLTSYAGAAPGSGDCAKFDAAGNLATNGAACGGALSVQNNGSLIGSRGTLNFIPGTTITPSMSDTGSVINVQLDVNAAVIQRIDNAQSGASLLCAPASASATTYTCALATTLTAYTSGMVLYVKVDTTDTGGGAVTLNVDALGAKGIKLADGSTNPAANTDWIAGRLYPVWYDGTNFRRVF